LVSSSGVWSGASSNSTTRSSEAIPDWSVAVIDASCVSGIENWRAYWIIACMSPTEIAPLEIRSPPTTAISTNWMLPKKTINGWIVPAVYWAPKLASYRASLSAAKRLSTSRWRPKVFTIACPVKTSSV
jgi:hypothetical protein